MPSLRGGVRYEDLGKPIQDLIKAMKREATAKEMLMFSKLTVLEMAHIFEQLGRNEEPEVIVSWLAQRHEEKQEPETDLQKQMRLDREADEEEEAEFWQLQHYERVTAEQHETTNRGDIKEAEEVAWHKIAEEHDEIIEREGSYVRSFMKNKKDEQCERDNIEGEWKGGFTEILNEFQDTTMTTDYAANYVQNYPGDPSSVQFYWALIRNVGDTGSVALALQDGDDATTVAEYSYSKKDLLQRILAVDPTDHCAWYQLASIGGFEEAIWIDGSYKNCTDCFVKAVELMSEKPATLTKEDEAMLSRSLFALALEMENRSSEITILGVKHTKIMLLILAIEWDWGYAAAWYALALILEMHEAVHIHGMRFTQVDINAHILNMFGDTYKDTAVLWKKMAENMDHDNPVARIGDTNYHAIDAFVRAAELSKIHLVDLAMHIAAGSTVKVNGEMLPHKKCLAMGLAAKEFFNEEITSTCKEAWAMMAMFLDGNEVYEVDGVSFCAGLCKSKAGEAFTTFWLTSDFEQAKRNYNERMNAIKEMRSIRRDVQEDENKNFEKMYADVQKLHVIAHQHHAERKAVQDQFKAGRKAIVDELNPSWELNIIGYYREVAAEYNARVLETFKPFFAELIAEEERCRTTHQEMLMQFLVYENHNLEERWDIIKEEHTARRQLHRYEVKLNEFIRGQIKERHSFESVEATKRNEVEVTETEARKKVVADIHAVMDEYNAKIAEQFRPKFTALLEEEKRARTRIINNVREPFSIIVEEEKEAHAEVLVWLLRMGNVREDHYGNKYTLLRNGNINVPQKVKINAIKPPALQWLFRPDSNAAPSIWKPVYNRDLDCRFVEFEHIPSGTRQPDILAALGLPETIILDQKGDNIPAIMEVLKTEGVWKQADGGKWRNTVTGKETASLEASWLEPVIPAENDEASLETQASLRQVASFSVRSRRQGGMFLKIDDPSGGPATYRNLKTKEIVDSVPSSAVVYAAQDTDDGDQYFFNTNTMSTYWDLPTPGTSVGPSPERGAASTTTNTHVDPVVPSQQLELTPDDEEAEFLRQLMEEEAAAVSSAATIAQSEPSKFFLQYTDPDTNDFYYMNVRTGETAWELPEGATVYVRAVTDAEEEYFYNADTRSTHWELEE